MSNKEGSERNSTYMSHGSTTANNDCLPSWSNPQAPDTKSELLEPLAEGQQAKKIQSLLQLPD